MEKLQHISKGAIEGRALLIIFGLLFSFHLLVLLGIIPPTIVWAGKIKSSKDLILLESISLLVLVIASVFVLLKMRSIHFGLQSWVINIGMWILFVFFSLNTIGNMTAMNPIEKYGFGFLTFLIALLSLRLTLKT